MKEDVKVGVLHPDEIWVGSRTREDFGDLGELATSLKEEGIIQSLCVQHTPGEEKPYKLLAGERRLRAIIQAELTQIPVRIYSRELSPLEMESIELAENLYRKDFTYAEDCKIKRRIYDLQLKIHGRRVSKDPNAPGTTQKEVAEAHGYKKSQFHDDVELAKAIEVIPELGECKNKAEAMRLYKSLKEDVIKQELARRAEQEVDDTPVGNLHKALCDRYIVGDFFEMIKKVPNKSINLVELDPPYAIDLQSMKKTTHGKFPYNPDNYNEVGLDVYPNFMREVFKECYRVMSEHSWMILWFGPDPWFETLYQLASEAGFEGRRIPGIWLKPSGQTMQPSYNLANCFEMFFYLRKGKPAIIQQGRSNAFEYPPVPPSKKIHPTERPIEMISDILATFCSESARVLVPFAGSGNTLLASANMKMTGIGYDLTESYKDSYILRVHQSKPGEYSSY